MNKYVLIIYVNLNFNKYKLINVEIQKKFNSMRWNNNNKHMVWK